MQVERRRDSKDGKGSVVERRARRNTRTKEEHEREKREVGGGAVEGGGGGSGTRAEGVPLIPRYNAHITYPSP